MTVNYTPGTRKERGTKSGSVGGRGQAGGEENCKQLRAEEPQLQWNANIQGTLVLSNNIAPLPPRSSPGPFSRSLRISVSEWTTPMRQVKTPYQQPNAAKFLLIKRNIYLWTLVLRNLFPIRFSENLTRVLIQCYREW